MVCLDLEERSHLHSEMVTLNASNKFEGLSTLA